MKRRVLVTGSSRGIGRAIAMELGQLGFEVSVHCHSNLEAAQEVWDELNRIDAAGEIFQFDVADRATAQPLLMKSVESRGAFYGVVLNAGITRDQPFPGLDQADWDQVINTNLDSFYTVLHPLVMPMIQLRQGGRIVTMSSVSGMIGNRGQVNYSAAKAGIIGASKALSKELAKRRISVNCVAPGFILTDMTKDLMAHDQIIESIPMRRAGQPQEVAALVGFLFSEKAEYITGQVISINGGLA